ncbi:hypothetical protein [Zunongwangia endophytica]|uniref:Uncharacterized protein n=1 Tax=Zunongwangia endophytica TaxID=1808945 RepID=A0ABV8H8L8_9FLAO|nr:hypothetical protein [Zunongwangia endophytica]MDN3595329.1 hypothetical protein [Zunongwangia endophytica]
METHKKLESVSELRQNDIQELQTEKIKSDILRISENWDLNLKPEDPNKPMQVIYGNDTLNSTNANVSLSKNKETENAQSVTDKKTEKLDQSKSEKEKGSSEKGKSTDRQSPSWGLNIGLIFGIILSIILISLYFKTKTPKP